MCATWSAEAFRSVRASAKLICWTLFSGWEMCVSIRVVRSLCGTYARNLSVRRKKTHCRADMGLMRFRSTPTRLIGIVRLGTWCFIALIREKEDGQRCCRTPAFGTPILMKLIWHAVRCGRPATSSRAYACLLSLRMMVWQFGTTGTACVP